MFSIVAAAAIIVIVVVVKKKHSTFHVKKQQLEQKYLSLTIQMDQCDCCILQICISSLSSVLLLLSFVKEEVSFE